MRILAAMSGGVDSSVAAALLTEAGHTCIGCTMKLYKGDDSACCSNDDVRDARRVALLLGMPYYVFNFTEDFREQVIQRFIDSYYRGETPNPCIDCNRYMKFDKLFERARQLECEAVATGHYAQVEKQGGRYVLKKAADASKDQSYVLYRMTQEQLAHTVFPLGALAKEHVRQIAEERGFSNAHKPDSQDICFVPNGDYGAVIEEYTGQKSEPGFFVDSRGQGLGRHNGIIRYTIGQHKGLGLALDEKRYVCRICPEDNTVVLGKNEELYSRAVWAEEVNWVEGEPPAGQFRCRVRLRYRQPEEEARVVTDGRSLHIIFDRPQRAATPGQAAVLYEGERCLGGGVIRIRRP